MKQKTRCIEKLYSVLFVLTQPVRVATTFCSAILHAFQSNATHAGCNVTGASKCKTKSDFNLTQPVWIATCFLLQSKYSNRNFNLTQPVWVVTANLHKRSNKLSCILYNVCLFFDHTIWSDTTYCNGIISFLYNT